MKRKQRIIKWPENLKVKAMVVEADREIQELAEAIKVSRNWLSLVLNGHQPGPDTIEKVKEELSKSTINQ